MINLANYIDHTLLKADAKIEDIATLCNEAITHGFYAVCVNTCHVKRAYSLLKNSNVSIAACVGFPLGAMHQNAKAAEAAQAVSDGAKEIDMVINIGYLKSGLYKEVCDDMRMVKTTVGQDIIVKSIFENCLLDDTDKRIACKLAIEAGIDFVKTSTGFSTGNTPAHGATKEDLQLMLEEVSKTGIKVKAAGGVKDFETAISFIDMGVSRIGTSSGITLLKGATTAGGY